MKYFQSGDSNHVSPTIPTLINLSQNYPNPFNPTTRIKFTIYKPAKVTLKVYNAVGQEVRTLISARDYNISDSEVLWDGKNNAGQAVSSGVYFYRLQAGSDVETKKMLLIK